MTEPVIFELSRPERKAYSLPDVGVPDQAVQLPDGMLRESAAVLPEISKQELVRHFNHLSRLNYGVDTGFYPLGSCTMKYNPKVNEWGAALSGFTQVHPYQREEDCQGALALLHFMENYLAEIGGMDRVTLQPAAGAQGELTGMKIISAYHHHRGEGKRRQVIVPDSAHGTNPATAAMCGFTTVEVASNDRGEVDLHGLEKLLSDETAALMLTNPNTLGLFETQIEKISEMVHDAGGLLYYDGANMNAIMGICKPGDMGFDVVHFNLHKTFSAPHGGGGPGSGPVGVKHFLAPFLPVPTVEYEEEGSTFYWDYARDLSIGKIKSFYGNFNVIVKAYTYIRALGADGLTDVSRHAVLNANYLKQLLHERYGIPFDRVCKHEFIMQPKQKDVHTLDIAKRLIDYGYHPPTIYFPLVVSEAMMVEPTETESKETLEKFAEVMKLIITEAVKDPKLLTEAPHHAPVGRLDEVAAARKPKLKWL
ncbi:aminomethyl-transferring glycine dehydrogenase subunit GcvPB [Metallumcola ferriviriculae]|uniref:Probable glycine dehydrogenase (decarboxylating) subunit 2 n=1 Tax=Metallumcola ferriviriculae TaxID=3039180 RepID=A0AAU0US19_9FIRM|nr:aminomethyl-transferring glycine dehydrogenase subunit GcvPB [Desulfitibacteraceae bacterium MK1]